MGIVNVTPDSFSDGGEYVNPQTAVDAALRMVEEGASIIDVGGESTRPGAAPVDGDAELSRVLPVIELLARKSNVVISIDTYRASTALAAVNAGAHIINDVWGLQKDLKMAESVARTGAGVVIMHTGRGRNVLTDVIEDQQEFLDTSLALAKTANISDDAIILDPGIGFAKDKRQCLALLDRLEELHQFGYPLLIGTSRKRFLGAVTGRSEAAERDIATAATSIVARMKGATIFRVHDVAANRDALKVGDALIGENRSNEKTR